MTVADATTEPVYWDPFDAALARDPYPVYARLREEAPLYYNERHDFYAVSRYADCQRGLADWQTYSSARGDILEIIQADIELPPGTLIFEDPPVHDIHRRLLARVFTPRRIAQLEPKIRAYCERVLEPVTGADRFDLVAAVGAEMPMRVIGMLLGIPEADQVRYRDRTDATLETGDGGRIDSGEILNAEGFQDYIDWRKKHPSDDLMTELMTAEFEDENGIRRTLTDAEVLTYCTVVAGAGNETTGRLIGWFGALMARYPEARRELAAEPALIPNAIEEILRFEPTGPFTARCVTRDVELHGSTVPPTAPSSSSRPPPTATRTASPTRMSSTSTGSASTCRSASARTTAWAPHSPAWRERWQPRRSCGASPPGRSTGRARSWPRPRPYGAGRRCRSSSRSPEEDTELRRGASS